MPVAILLSPDMAYGLRSELAGRGDELISSVYAGLDRHLYRRLQAGKLPFSAI